MYVLYLTVIQVLHNLKLAPWIMYVYKQLILNISQADISAFSTL
jgi:hypothetical protein